MAGIRLTGVTKTSARLIRIGERTNKQMLRRVRKGALQIQDRAREFAPVDEGDLEQSIVATEVKEGRRLTQFIGVDPAKLGDGYNKYGFRYDVRMHEDAGYKLGPRSQAKADASGHTVGPKYLSRALEEFEPIIAADIRRIVQRETQS